MKYLIKYNREREGDQIQILNNYSTYLRIKLYKIEYVICSEESEEPDE